MGTILDMRGTIPQVPIRAESVVVVLITTGSLPKLLLLKRTGRWLNGEWLYIAGRLARDETAWEAAFREVQEETGIKLPEIYSADCFEQFYHIQDNCIVISPVFVGYVSEQSRIRLNEEHTAYKWVSHSQAMDEISFPNQRLVIDQVMRCFAEKPPNQKRRILKKGQSKNGWKLGMA